MIACPEEDFAARCATTKHTVSASLCEGKHYSDLYTLQYDTMVCFFGDCNVPWNLPLQAGNVRS
jgi:hypothetical protein